MEMTPSHDLRDMFRTTSWSRLSEAERAALAEAMRRVEIARDTNQEFLDARTSGERLADRIAELGGSWGFIVTFLAFLLVWAVTNTLVLRSPRAPDPFPFIFLNLLLSMLAALQAPIIMMAQNRMARKDRLDASADYQVNLKAELEIREVQGKLDALLGVDWPRLIGLQEEQLLILRSLQARMGTAE